MAGKKLILMCLAVAGGIGPLAARADSHAVNVERIGYYKSAARDRVMSFCADGYISQDRAAAVFAGVDHTAGALTLAVIYPCPDVAAPADGVTLARSLGDAMALVASPPFDQWQWRLQVNPVGDRTISARETSR